jgi:hypothetical protein
VDKDGADVRAVSIDGQPHSSPHIPRQYARTTVQGAMTRLVRQDLGERPHPFRLVGILDNSTYSFNSKLGLFRSGRLVSSHGRLVSSHGNLVSCPQSKAHGNNAQEDEYSPSSDSLVPRIRIALCHFLYPAMRLTNSTTFCANFANSGALLRIILASASERLYVGSKWV